MPSPGAIVNIAGLNPVDDPEYRYKMPSVFGKIEGRGNGIKTVIPNISDVAGSLHRPPGEVNKFFGCELGAQTSYVAATDRAVVNGAHTDAVLQQRMHRYIENFVLCPQCGLPETKYKIKNDAIFHRCAACGAKEMVDMSHKLCTYILAQAKKEKRDKKNGERRSPRRQGRRSKGDSDDGDEKKKKKKKDKKDKKDKEKKKEEKSSNGHDNGGNEKDLNGVDDLSIEEAIDDEDALEENVILEWAVEGRNDFTFDVVEEETRAVLRGEAKPAVVWLQEADSNDSDDE